MEKECRICISARPHTEQFEKVREVILGELKARNLNGVDDISELATALSVLLADALGIDIYQ